MKKLTLTIIALILFNGLFAQYKHYNEETKQWKDYPSYEEYIFEESEFIFEGKTTDFKTFRDEKSQKIYTVNMINVSKILRGSSKINIGTIEIIQEGASCGITSDGEIIFIEKDDGYRSTINGIYFCTSSNYPSHGTIQCLRTEKDGWMTNPNLYLLPNNSMQVQEIENIDYYTNFGIGKKFNNKQEIYDFLRKQDNMVIPSDNNLPIKKKDASGSLDVKNKEKYTQNLVS